LPGISTTTAAGSAAAAKGRIYADRLNNGTATNRGHLKVPIPGERTAG